MLRLPDLTWEELRKRRVPRVAVAYVLAAAVIVEAGSVVFPALLLPEWTVRLVVALSVLGFPFAVVLAWAFDFTPDGIRRAEPSHSGFDPPRIVVSKHINVAPVALAVLVLAGGVSWWAVGGRRSQSIQPGGALRAVAVLPCADLSDTQDQVYFADGVAEEILMALAGVPGLRVPAATSSFRFRDRTQDARHIGDILGVEALLECSVRRSGQRLRINAQLVRTGDGYTIWSDRYDRTDVDLFAVQEEIAAEILRSVGLEGYAAGLAAGRSGPTAAPQAHELYLEARYFSKRPSADNLLKALDLLTRAVAIDPAYARAHAALATIYLALPLWYLMSEDEALVKAESAAARAMDLDSSLPEAHAALAQALSARGRRTEAKAAYRRAIALDPGFLSARSALAEMLLSEGLVERSLLESRSISELDPFHGEAGYAHALLVARDFEAAEAVARSAIIRNPQRFLAQAVLAMALVEQAEWDEALAAVGDLVRMHEDDNDALTWRAYVQIRSGNPEPARELLARFSGSTGLKESPAHVALLSAWLGDLDAAFEWYGRAREEQQRLVRAHLAYNMRPDFDVLRADARFHELLREYGYR